MPPKKLSSQQRTTRKTRASDNGESSSTIEVTSQAKMLNSNAPEVKESKKRARETSTTAAREIASSTSSSTVACAALNIVLQRMTIPNLDWSMDVLDARLPTLRSQIIEDRMKLAENSLSSTEETESHIAQLQSSLENEIGFFEATLVDTLQNKLEDINPVDLFAEMALVPMTSEEYTRAKADSKLLQTDSDNDDNDDNEDATISDNEDSNSYYYYVKQVKPAVERVVFSRYWSPVKHLLQYQMITIVKALREIYLKLYHQVMEWFHNQQKRYAEVTSLVVHQLVSLEHCLSWLELLEFPLFSLAMTPLQLEKEHTRKAIYAMNMAVSSKTKLLLSKEDIIELLDYLIDSCHEYYDNARIWLFKPVYESFNDVINKIQERIQSQEQALLQRHQPDHQQSSSNKQAKEESSRYPKRIRKSSAKVIEASSSSHVQSTRTEIVPIPAWLNAMNALFHRSIMLKHGSQIGINGFSTLHTTFNMIFYPPTSSTPNRLIQVLLRKMPMQPSSTSSASKEEEEETANSDNNSASRRLQWLLTIWRECLQHGIYAEMQIWMSNEYDESDADNDNDTNNDTKDTDTDTDNDNDVTFADKDLVYRELLKESYDHLTSSLEIHIPHLKQRLLDMYETEHARNGSDSTKQHLTLLLHVVTGTTSLNKSNENQRTKEQTDQDKKLERLIQESLIYEQQRLAIYNKKLLQLHNNNNSLSLQRSPHKEEYWYTFLQREYASLIDYVSDECILYITEKHMQDLFENDPISTMMSVTSTSGTNTALQLATRLSDTNASKQRLEGYEKRIDLKQPVIALARSIWDNVVSKRIEVMNSGDSMDALHNTFYNTLFHDSAIFYLFPPQQNDGDDWSVFVNKCNDKRCLLLRQTLAVLPLVHKESGIREITIANQLFESIFEHLTKLFDDAIVKHDVDSMCWHLLSCDLFLVLIYKLAYSFEDPDLISWSYMDCYKLFEAWKDQQQQQQSLVGGNVRATSSTVSPRGIVGEIEDRLFYLHTMIIRFDHWLPIESYFSPYYGEEIDPHFLTTLDQQLRDVGFLGAYGVPWHELRKSLHSIKSSTATSLPLVITSKKKKVKTNLVFMHTYIQWTDLLLQTCLFKIEAVNVVNDRFVSHKDMKVSFFTSLFDKIDWIIEKASVMAKLYTYFSNEVDTGYSDKKGNFLKWLQLPCTESDIVTVLEECSEDLRFKGKHDLEEAVKTWYEEYYRLRVEGIERRESKEVSHPSDSHSNSLSCFHSVYSLFGH